MGERRGGASGVLDAPVSPRVAVLLQELEAELALDPTDLPGAQAMVDLDGLLEAQRLLSRVLLRRVGDAEARQLAPLVDSPTLSSWLRAQDAPVPADTVTTSRRLSRHASVEQAVLAGALSVPAGSLIARVLAGLRPHLDRPDGLLDGQDADAVVQAVVVDGVLDQVCTALGGLADDDLRVAELAADLSEVAHRPTTQLDRLEAAFLLLARHLPPGLPLLRAALGTLLDALRPQQLQDAADRAHRDRGLTLTPHHDRPGGHLCADLDAECFELLHTALTAAAEGDPDNPLDTRGWADARAAGWEFGDPIPTGLQGSTCTVIRSARQRWHDALRLLAAALLDSGALGQRGKTAPHLGVTVPLGALVGQAGALPAVGSSGQHLPLSLVRQWWADAHITRYVLGLGRRVIETSHSERTLKPHERRIKQLETAGRCQGAGCTRGPGTHPGCRLIPHHVHPWAQCGRTSLTDTVWLCEATHAALHRGATITLEDGRRLTEDGWL